MGSRSTGEGAHKVYGAVEVWVERALRRDDSLFVAGKPIWSNRWLGELRERYLDQPDVPGEGFYGILKRQLRGGAPEVYQLMAEALYVHFAPATTVIGGATKKRRIRQVLGWSGEHIVIPEGLLGALEVGIGNPGPGFNVKRPWNVGFIVEFVLRWKDLSSAEQERLLGDPWDFKGLLGFTPTSKLFQEVSGDGAYRLQRDALLHLVHPDTFERIFSFTHKKDIAAAYADLIHEDTDDIDHKLQQVRCGMETVLGRDFDFYEDPLRRRWDPPARKQAWDGFINRARAFVEAGEVDSQENDHKIEIGQKLEQARTAVVSGANDWADLVKSRLIGNLIHHVQLTKLKDWVTASPGEALGCLRAIWTRDNVPVSDRIRTFSELLPQSVIGGPGTRTTVASQFLMGLDVYRYPPFRITLFNDTYDHVGYRRPEGADEAVLYDHALGFLDRFIEEAAERGVELRHRLDAQSLVWMILTADVFPGIGRHDPRGLSDLAEELLVGVDFLEEIDILLKEKKQVIFQGPPGTGKTYVARRLAECLAGSGERVTLVQFHPSFAYEDFVQGYRPILSDERAGFALRNGPLLTAAERARNDPGSDHFLVIDEINRGNLAKVFGELYFLLEYRDQKMRLQYQTDDDEEFSLPKNLYIIGTMNTADRSIALVDLALRRRFYFVEFHPDDEPIKGLLRKWLETKAPDMVWVADVIDLANKKLENDRHIAIGPSYFMGTDDQGNAAVSDETSVRRIWKHSVRPYIEEHLFGNIDSTDEWDLDKLRKQAQPPPQRSDGTTEEPVPDDAPD